MKRIRIAPSVEKMRPAGWYRSFAGRANMWVTAPPRIDPMMPSTIVQKIVIWTCITDFAITPEISPMTIYQIKWNILSSSFCPGIGLQGQIPISARSLSGLLQSAAFASLMTSASCLARKAIRTRISSWSSRITARKSERSSCSFWGSSVALCMSRQISRTSSTLYKRMPFLPGQG